MKNIPERILSLLFAGVIFISLSAERTTDVVNAHTVLDGLFKSLASVKTLTYQLAYAERKDDGKMRKDTSQIKYQKSPFRVYMKMAEGAEILWGPDMNDGEALVHPAAFPYINLNLDPYGNTMRKNQHHGIEASGFEYFGGVLQNGVKKVADFDNQVLYLGDIAFNGYNCYNISVINPDFRYVPYVAQKGENLIAIARKFSVDEFMVQLHNHLSSFNDVKEGQTVYIPSNYGKILSLYIEKTNMVPVMIRIEDEKGLFEEYHFLHLKVNPDIPAEEFTKSYKGYHF